MNACAIQAHMLHLEQVRRSPVCLVSHALVEVTARFRAQHSPILGVGMVSGVRTPLRLFFTSAKCPITAQEAMYQLAQATEQVLYADFAFLAMQPQEQGVWENAQSACQRARQLRL